MVLSLVLPWFPVLLGVGVGARLLGRTRGLCLGILCALFWIVLVQASSGYIIWRDPWTVATIVAGALAIAAIGAWAGETPVNVRPTGPASWLATSKPANGSAGDGSLASQLAGDKWQSDEDRAGLQQLAAAFDEFDDWLELCRDDNNPWPKFDDFIRSLMCRCCQATHVRPYRLLSESEELVPLREAEGLAEVKPVSARQGIVGHVITTGRSYLADDLQAGMPVTQGELVERLAQGHGVQSAGLGADEGSASPIVWCFPVRQGTRRQGVVTVGHLGIAPQTNQPLLRAVERMVAQFWAMLSETIQSRSAVQNDPVSGLPTRPTFLRLAEQSLAESYQQCEPVAVVVLALEGLRELSDTGRWDAADELMHEVGRVLTRKVRIDDRLGRFDGSRFLLLLRRVDSELASLIVSQLIARVAALCADRMGPTGKPACRLQAGLLVQPVDDRPDQQAGLPDPSHRHASIGVRCGLAGSGTSTPDLRTLVLRALDQCRRARLESIPLATDLGAAPVASGTTA